MATGGTVCRYSPMDTSQENAEVHCEGSALHERLVAYVYSLEHGARRGVWREHSYARGVGEPARGSRRARTLLAARAPSPPGAPLDVGGPGDAAPCAPRDDDDDDDDEEGWEARVEALAPSAAHARLARTVCDALRRARLERLAVRGGCDGGGALAGVLRRALAPLWARGAAPAWLQGALAASMPRGPRRLYAEAVERLRATAPRLAERLTGAWAAPARAARAWGPALGPGAGPWLVWVSSGCAAQDARWERRLSAAMHTRVLRWGGAGAGGGEGAASPEAWCAAAAGAVRSQLTDALAEAGSRAVILGGVGAGAALCVVLARGAGGAGRAAGGVRGAVLLAPPLRTAEGAPQQHHPLRAVRLPLLLVLGARSPLAPHALANRIAESGPRRLLAVRGADAALRLPRRARRRLRLSQDALDAALAEECVRWALETAESEEAPPSPPSPVSPPLPPPPPLPAPHRRHPLPTIVHQIDLDGPDDEYAHLPASALSAQSARSIEIVEGRVVSRAAGGTPLPLLPPARRGSAPPSPAAPPSRAAPPAACVSSADIMDMPVVLAEEPAAAAAEPSATGSLVTVTSGKARGSGGGGGGGGTLALTPSVTMTRVIVAKRGAPAPARPRGGWGGARGGGVVRVRGGGGGGPGPQRLLVRRGVRVMTRGRVGAATPLRMTDTDN